jgi:CHAD domain-containing protein
MPSIPLSDDQKQKLMAIAQSAPELLVHRARLILAYAAGKPTLLAANEAGISRGRARYWKRQFIARGMSIFSLEEVSPSGAGKTDASPEIRDKKQQIQSIASLQPGGCADDQREIPYPQPIKSMGIRPEDTLAEAGRKVWLFHFALMLSHERGTLIGEDVEELHDMRVATRRMRTAFDVFGQAFDPKTMKHYLKGLRRLGRALGGVRDMDVILAHALDYQRKMDEVQQLGLEPLLAAWKQMIHKKRTRMTRHLQSEDYQNFKYNFNQFLQASEHGMEVGGYTAMTSHLGDIVPILVYERYATVRAYETILPTASMAQLHALRIEFKKLRYILEYFREILGDNTGQAISELKQLQDHLGELHDSDVACQLVGDFLKGWDKEQSSRQLTDRQNPETIVTYLAHLYAERYQLVSSFPELWRKFNRPEFRQNIAQAISVL